MLQFGFLVSRYIYHDEDASEHPFRGSILMSLFSRDIPVCQKRRYCALLLSRGILAPSLSIYETIRRGLCVESETWFVVFSADLAVVSSVSEEVWFKLVHEEVF